MSRRRRGSSLLWALALVALTVGVIVGSSPGRARALTPPGAICLPGPCSTSTSSSSSSSTSSTSSSTSSTSTTTTTAPPGSVSSSYNASFVPCGSTSGPCTQSPEQLQMSYPAGPAAAVELDWVSQGRATGAPNPDSTSVTLTWSDGTACGSGDRCWPWPAGMTASSYVLNGTYRVAACASYTGGSCGSPSSPQEIQVAAPPGAPTQVRARASGNQVTVSWQPPTADPPDLAGYTVVRNGTDVYSCSVDGLGPGASVPCPASLTVADRPGNGRYAYAVRAVRLGVDTASSDTVSSAVAAAAGGSVTVSGPPAAAPGAGGGTVTGVGGGSLGGFTPSPVIGSAGVTGATAALQPGAGQALPGGSAETGAPGSPQNLQYPSDNPVVGAAAPLDLKVHTTPGRTDVVPVAVLALGLLLLAIAAHFLYLRAQVGLIQAGAPGSGRGAELAD